MRRALEIAAGVVLIALARWVAGMAPSAAPSAPSAPGAGSAASSAAPSAPASASDAREGSMLAHADDVASYTLKVSLDPAAHTLHGEGSIRWRNASRVAQRELFVHLYLNAFKNDRTLFLRRRDEGFRGGGGVWDHGYIQVRRFHVRELDADVWPDAPTTPGDPDDETDIRVPLPRAIEPGASITIDVVWDAKLPSLALRTGYVGAFHMVGQWFPKLARLEDDGRWAHFPYHRLSEFYADFGSYDVTIDAPEAFVVGATGRLVSEAREGGRATRRFAQDDVHDFAFAAGDNLVEATAEAEDGIAIRCLYPPGHARSAAIEIDAARFGLERLGRLYGRYPYATLTLVHPPENATEAGGMEYPTLITTGGEWYMPWTGVPAIEDVTLHELAHQWFYGLVATNEHEHPFLDEGLTTFAEIDAMEALFPDASAARVAGYSLGLPAVHRAASLEADQDAPVASPASAFVTGFDYGALVYARTATSLLSLANVYGASAVRGALGAYARRHRFRHPSPDDLFRAIREGVGDVAADALRAALVDRGWVDYVASDVTPMSASIPRGVFGSPDKPSSPPIVAPDASPRGAALVRRLGTIILPVDVDLIGEDGSATRVRWDARESAAWLSYSGPSALAAVVVDPEHRVLLDRDLSNNAARVAGPRVAFRALDLALFASELGLHVLSP